jgi:hypothetical protein
MKRILTGSFLLWHLFTIHAQGKYGASIPWTSYEAELMHTNGTILGPQYDPWTVELESSGQKCVRLANKEQFVEFIAAAAANTMVIRYSVPDRAPGKSWWSSVTVYNNGRLVRTCLLNPRYMWLYGKYPFSNDPQSGEPRHFFDETRIQGLVIKPGDRIQIRPSGIGQDTAGYCIIDLVDLEKAPPPRSRPAHSLSVTDKEFGQPGKDEDFTQTFRNCISKAVVTGQTVWIPRGSYKISGDIVIPAHTVINGVGFWYSELKGTDSDYSDPNRRVRLKGSGDSIHLSDFAITGMLTYRSDSEPNDGIVGSFGTGSTISRIWIEHTKVGMWIENSRDLRISGCRMRNTIADGINFCVGVSRSVIEDCTARGTGDDCFAFWPATFLKQQFQPGDNTIVHCTGQLPFLANGAAIYGGKSNSIRNCYFSDISQGSAILISTTFPTAGKDNIPDNNFSGQTLVDNCHIARSGGYDHEWGWRAAIEICLDKRDISGITISRVLIDSSLSNGLSIVEGKLASAVLSDASFEKIGVSGYGLGMKDSHALFVAGGARGNLVLKDSAGIGIENRSARFYVRSHY